MKTVTIVCVSCLVALVIGSLTTMAVIYDGIYIQLLFDFGVMLVSGILGFILKSGVSKKQS